MAHLPDKTKKADNLPAKTASKEPSCHSISFLDKSSNPVSISKSGVISSEPSPMIDAGTKARSLKAYLGFVEVGKKEKNKIPFYRTSISNSSHQQPEKKGENPSQDNQNSIGNTQEEMKEDKPNAIYRRPIVSNTSQREEAKEYHAKQFSFSRDNLTLKDDNLSS